MSVKFTATFIEPDGTISGYASEDQTNTSRLEKLSIPSLGEKLFYLSEDPNKVTSPLDGEHLWFDENIGYSGWVSKTYSDAQGKFTAGQEPKIQITGDIKHLVLYGDLIEEHFIEVVEVNGIYYTNSNEKLVIVLPERQTDIEIKIIKVNAPYQPVKVTGIELGLEVEFDSQDIVSYDFGSQSVGDADNIDYGVISRFGKISLDNSDNLFTNLNDLDLLDEDLVAHAYINDKKFGSYLLRNGSLNYGDTSVNFQLTDDLIDLDQLNWNKAFYMQENQTVKSFLDFIFNFINKEYVVYDSITESIITSITLASTILEVDNIKEVLVSICETCQCCIFKNNEGKITIKYMESNKSEVS